MDRGVGEELGVLYLLIFLMFYCSIFGVKHSFNRNFSRKVGVDRSNGRDMRRTVGFQVTALVPGSFSSFGSSICGRGANSCIPITCARVIAGIGISEDA